MQGNGTVRIHNTLGFAGGSRGVAHPQSVIFIQVRISGFARALLEQRLIVFVAMRSWLTAERCHDHAFDFYLVFYRLEDRQQDIVYDQEPVRGMVDDVGQFFGMQSQVEGMQYASHNRNGEISLQVEVM